MGICACISVTFAIVLFAWRHVDIETHHTTTATTTTTTTQPTTTSSLHYSTTQNKSCDELHELDLSNAAAAYVEFEYYPTISTSATYAEVSGNGSPDDYTSRFMCSDDSAIMNIGQLSAGIQPKPAIFNMLNCVNNQPRPAQPRPTQFPPGLSRYQGSVTDTSGSPAPTDLSTTYIESLVPHVKTVNSDCDDFKEGIPLPDRTASGVNVRHDDSLPPNYVVSFASRRLVGADVRAVLHIASAMPPAGVHHGILRTQL